MEEERDRKGPRAVTDRRAGGDRRLGILRRLGHEIRYATDARPVLRSGLDSALAMVNAEIGALSYADMSTQRYVLAASRGLSEAYLAGVESWSLHEGLAGRAFGLREPLTVTDLRASREVPRKIVHAEHLRGYVCVPLLRGQRRLGIIEVFDREPRSFGAEEVESLELVAAFASSVVESLVMADEVQFLREERARVLRQWTTQALTAADTQRHEVVRSLLAEADSVERAGAQDGATVAARIRLLARQIGQGEVARVDMVPLVQEAITDRLSSHFDKQVSLEVGEWPASLPLELTTRLYLLMYGLTSAAVQAAESAVTLRLGGEPDSMWIQVCDDRPRGPGSDPLQEASADLQATVRGMGGSLEVAVDDGHRGLRVVLPRLLSKPEVAALTPRERRVLEGLSVGTSNREIAAELGISPKTLQNHLTTIYRKLGVTSRAQALQFL